MALEGQVAIVTGGTRGIGLAIAKVLLERGCKVCISGVKKENGEHALTELKGQCDNGDAMFFQSDVTDKGQLEDLFRKTVDKYRRLDILVNNAGVILEGNWELMVNTNLNAVIRGTYLGLQIMDKNNGGHGGVIINVGSLSSIEICGYLPVYVATKHAIKGFTESVGLTSVERYGVRVNALCPGWVSTDMMSRVTDPSDQHLMLYGPDGAEKARQSISSRTPASVEGVAEVFMQVLADKNINGQCMAIRSDEKSLLQPATNLDHLTFSPIH